MADVVYSRDPEAPRTWSAPFAGSDSLELSIQRRIDPPQIAATPMIASAAMLTAITHSRQRDPAATPRLSCIAEA